MISEDKKLLKHKREKSGNLTNGNEALSQKLVQKILQKTDDEDIKVKIGLENLPTSSKYEKSYMHRDFVNKVICLEKTNFIITVSIEGILKIWQKSFIGIEFVKQFKAHQGIVTGLSASENGIYAITCSEKDEMLKLFDVVNYDLINFSKMNFKPVFCQLLSSINNSRLLSVLTEKGKGHMHIVDPLSNGESLKIINFHDSEISCLSYSYKLDAIVSCDREGGIEFFSTLEIKAQCEEPKKKQSKPKSIIISDPTLFLGTKYSLKAETDLYVMVESMAHGLQVSWSHNAQYTAIFCSDRNIRIFDSFTGKLFVQYDESSDFYLNSKKSSNSAINEFDSMSLQKRVKQEKEMEKEFDKSPGMPLSNIEFDETDTFIYYPSIIGVKLVHLQSGKLIKVLGDQETERFIHVSLMQGKALRNTSGIIGSGGDSSQGEKIHDPCLLAIAYKKSRFFIFSQREPEEELKISTVKRDIYNEKPTKQEIQETNEEDRKQLPTQAIIDTSLGEIHLRLYPNECPKTVKNFVSLAENNFYNHLIFHRVIKGFMIQTGCPNGNGTGGTSIWGCDFEDEFSSHLKHDIPYTVSMANRGPNTNGSQFFITTAPASWLDNKHTVFGRVFKGIDTVQSIESVECDHKDKPLMDVKLYQIRIVK